MDHRKFFCFESHSIDFEIVIGAGVSGLSYQRLRGRVHVIKPSSRFECFVWVFCENLRGSIDCFDALEVSSLTIERQEPQEAIEKFFVGLGTSRIVDTFLIYSVVVHRTPNSFDSMEISRFPFTAKEIDYSRHQRKGSR